MANFNYNKSLLGGRLTADPELKQTTGGTSVTSFSVAVGRKFKKEGQPDCDFINCVAFGKSAELISKYFSKGSSIFVEGELQVRSWTDNAGQKRYATEVIVSDVRFVDSKSENGVQSSESRVQSEGSYIPDAYSMLDTKLERLDGDDALPF